MQQHHTEYLTDRALASRYGISRPTVWRWVAAGILPRPIKLSPGCTRWLTAAVEQRDRERAQQAAA